MDIKREPPKKTKRYIAIAGGVVALGAVTLAIGRLKPAAPPVERGTLWIDTVKRGELKIEVNAPGTLEPENPRNITALTSGRVEDLPIQPGATVTPSTVLVVMSNPDEQITELQDEQQLASAIGNLANLKTTLNQQILSEQGAVASARLAFNNALRQASVDDSLAKKQLVSANDAAAARDVVTQTKQQLDIEQRRLGDMQASESTQIQLAQDQVNGLQRILAQQKDRLASMRVTSPEGGQLQMLGNPPLELGQYITAGSLIARVITPGRLKAVLRVPEGIAKDVAPGQAAMIDLHNNDTIPGHVTRKDPSSEAGTITVDVALDAPVPAGTSSELAVDGTIEVARLKNVMYVGRPGFGQENGSVGMFKILPNKAEADRVTVQLGRASVNQIVVQSGLSVGDSVIISDMSPFDAVSRVKIK